MGQKFSHVIKLIPLSMHSVIFRWENLPYSMIYSVLLKYVIYVPWYPWYIYIYIEFGSMISNFRLQYFSKRNSLIAQYCSICQQKITFHFSLFTEHSFFWNNFGTILELKKLINKQLFSKIFFKSAKFCIL